jgi:GNAT superfamily N-acetyltransferase
MNAGQRPARVYVAHRSDGVVAGYPALVAGSVSREEEPERISRGLAAHPIGVVVLARLAVTLFSQGSGLGVSLLQDALLRTQQAADTVGIRAVLVHAIDAKAREFYLKFGFSSSPIDDTRPMLLMRDLRAFLRKH